VEQSPDNGYGKNMFKSDNLSLAQFVGTDSEVPRSVAGAVKKQVQNEREQNGINLTKNWDFYQGFQRKYFNRRPNEDDVSFMERKKRAVIENFAKLIVDTNTKFLYSREEQIGRTYGKNKKTQDRLKHINGLIDIGRLQLDSKRQASIFGESIVRLVPTDEFTGKLVAGKKTTSATYPHPIHLDPQCTYVLIDAYGKIQAVMIESSYYDYVKELKIETIELVVEDSRWFWEDGKVTNSEKNSYSLDEEFVVQVNNSMRKDDITPTLVLQTKLNETITDQNFFFARHGMPQLVSEVDLSKVTMGDGKVWQIQNSEEDKKIIDQLFFLTWDGEMEGSMKHAKELESQILKLSYVAMISTGDISSTGQLRTGAALVTSYGPTIKLAQESKVTWAINEKKLNKAIAKFDARLHGQAVNVRFKDYDFRVSFPVDAGVPGEELVSAEVDAMQLNSHATTFRELIRRRHSYFTDEEVEAYYQEIIADSKDIADALRVFESVQTGEDGKPIDSSSKKSSEQSGQKA
jgi:hypothetical protein